MAGVPDSSSCNPACAELGLQMHVAEIRKIWGGVDVRLATQTNAGALGYYHLGL